MKNLFLNQRSVAPLLPLIAILVFAQQLVHAEEKELRGKRYGEVLLGRGGLLLPREMDVYNTIGLNDCPQELWVKLDKDQIKKDTGAKMVMLNGPRYWTIDNLKGSSLVSTAKKDFGGIAMRQAGTLQLKVKDKIAFGKPYVIHQVARKTIWTFKAGKPVFQLINPGGEVFFMQSYSVQKQPQTMEGLAELGKSLKLPAGWKFRSLTLKKDFEVAAINGMAYVVQDDFDNTYQKSVAKPDDLL